MSRYTSVPLRRLFRVVNGGTPTAHPENWDGRVPWATPIDLGRRNGGVLAETDRTLTHAGLRTGSATVPAGSLIVSTRAPIGYVVETTTPVAFNQGCRGLAARVPVHVRFYRYALESLEDQLQAAGQGSTFVELSGDQLAQQPVPRPRLREQGAIADFLDAETARIDALVAKKRRLIELLVVRASAVTDRLVLGFDRQPFVTSRTGFFLGVPAHWGETTMRHLGCHVQTGPFGSQLHAEDYVSDGWPVVNPANINDGVIIPIGSMAVSDAKRAELSRHILHRGDIVFGRRGEMGRAGLVTSNEAGWLCGTGSLRLRLARNSMLRPDYLKILLETAALRRYFELAAVGSTMHNLNSDIVLGMPCLVPSPAEQAEIVLHARARRTRTDELTGRLKAQVALLQEHRQALITAAVTGQMEVPGVAA